MINLTDSTHWQNLSRLAESIQSENITLNHLFATDEDRSHELSIKGDDFLFDFSKQLLTSEVMESLLSLLNESELKTATEAMFAGDKINKSEDRAVLHTALRSTEGDALLPEVASALAKMADFVQAIESGSWLGASGKPIRNIINIGIGGSDLGPAMVADALKDFKSNTLNVQFVSNVDPSHIHHSLSSLDASETLFIIASKSFTTLETHQNANYARSWFLRNGFTESDIAKHFVASTSNLDAACEFGIEAENLFPMWDWVGGRFSLWSTIGLPIALAIGMDNFKELLEGAAIADKHFREAEFSQNVPVMMALISIWNINFLRCDSTAVVPYSQRLNLFPAFLQQLYMESLGKQTDIDGKAANYRTAETLWGTAGTNGQHSYFQLLHQGSELIPVEFFAFSKPNQSESLEQHNHLLANCFAQSKALMDGTSNPSNLHKHQAGNKPSSTLIFDSLTPKTLGKIIAFEEHKVFVQSVVWRLNAFDQWGVQYGKLVAEDITPNLLNAKLDCDTDSSTRRLLNYAITKQQS